MRRILFTVCVVFATSGTVGASVVASASWTCVGICAPESALKGGGGVRLPEFTLQTNPKVAEVVQ